MNALFLGSLVATLFQPCKGSDSPSNGTVQFYSDDTCSQPSETSTSLAVNQCLETNQTSAIAALSFPSCSNDVQAVLYISDQVDCKRPSFWPSASTGDVEHCLTFATGSGIGSAAFVCVESVTTVSSGQTSQATSRPDSTATRPTATSTSSPTEAPEGSSQSSSHASAPSSGLSLSDRVNIAVGVSIGLAALIVGGSAAWYARISAVRPQRARWASHANSDPPPPYREFELYRY